MAAGPQAFYCLWQEEAIRETLFDLLASSDICAVRLASSACCNLVTKRLFLRMHLTFTANTFTKPSRVQALSRVGHHVEHLTFCLPHSDATFLPPLIHPLTGREISFLYTPHTSMASVLTRPKYGNPALGDVLTQQYPPLFHAATNVPSFLNAVKHLPNMRHLTIRCPGQNPQERYRRDIVDYALISLRISLERAPLLKLSKLSLSGVHPAAFNYLRHVPGFGAVPSAGRRWRQIRKLYMAVDAWDFYGPSPGLDHLKIIDDYIRNMAPQLEKLSFTWLNNGDDGDDDDDTGPARKGPCPLALSADPLFAPPRDSPKKLFNEVTGPMSPLPQPPRRGPMHLPRLRCLTLRNTTMNTPQLRDLVERHKRTVRELDFENVTLVDGCSWKEAFAPVLAQVSDRGTDVWSLSGGSDRSHGNGNGNGNGSASPMGSGRRSLYRAESPVPASPSSRLSAAAAVASPDDIEVSGPSAAVAAVSRDLLDLDIEDLESYIGFGSEPTVVADVPDQRQSKRRTPPPPTIQEEEEEEEDDDEEDDGGLASGIAAAHQASLTFTTRLKKRHVRRRRRRHHQDDSRGSETDECRSKSNRARRRHRRHRHGDGSDSKSQAGSTEDNKHAARSPSQPRSPRRPHHSRSRSRKGSGSSDSHRTATPPPPIPPLVPAVHDHPFAHRSPPPLPPQPRPLIVGQLDDNNNENKNNDDVFRPHTPSTPKAASVAASAEVAPLAISAPILNADPWPVLLQPTIYDPSSASTARVLSGSTAAADASDGLSPLQRQIEQEQKQQQQLMAEDADARASALQKAKAAVLTKLSREFHRRMGRETAQMAAAAAAATAAAAAASVPVVSSVGHGSRSMDSTRSASAFLSSLRLRERLFGESLLLPGGSAAAIGGGGDFYHRSMESNSAVVPLIFSRA